MERISDPDALDCCIVVPTFNERDNVEPLVEKLRAAAGDMSYEIVFVDDNSPDGTADLVKSMGRTDRRIRCIRRVGRRGLSSAVIEGALSTSADHVAVIDADMQHDETLIPKMIRELRDGAADVVVGSRYVEGGGTGTWDQSRVSMSKLATRVSRLVVRADLTDPMSGFFAVRRDVFERIAPRLSGEGFKILLDLFASSPTRLAFRELPYEFRDRVHGESKLDSLVLWEYAALLLDKMVGHIVPARFVMFAAIGFIGVFVHMLTLWVALTLWDMRFLVAQGVATIFAMTSNFFLNNVLTYRDQRLKGLSFFTGLLSFYAVCSLGVIGNVGVANFLFENQNSSWWLSGLAGTLVGVVWNYAASSIFTWRMKP
ncbi:MAG: glycosyltransferase family 2 protein [Alphaproteobacteria bacterium]